MKHKQKTYERSKDNSRENLDPWQHCLDVREPDQQERSREEAGSQGRFKPSFHREGERRHGTDRPTEGNPFLPGSEPLFSPSSAPTPKSKL